MKLQSLLILAAILIGMVACNKEEIQVEEQTTTSEDLTTFEDLVETTEEVEDLALETRGGDPTDCPTVTVTPDDGTFPRTVLIDFGTDGCEGPHGHIRKGIIQVELTDSFALTGAVRTVTYQNFSVDDVAIEGTKVLTNVGPNDDGLSTYTRDVNLSFAFPNGQTASWSGMMTITRIEGDDTPEVLDNVLEITGATQGVNRNGVPFNTEITVPLIKPRTCRWITSGVRTLTFNDQTRSIDYGDGECDRLATLTLANGNTRTILIRRWW